MASRFLIIMLSTVLSGCFGGYVSDFVEPVDNSMTKVIHGTDAVPDPVLQQVQKLEEQGLLTDVRIMESYPVKIEITGPAQVVSCLDSPGGKWLTRYNECENMQDETCTSLRGGFDSCASPCRHDTENFLCVQSCVPVCRFGDI